MVPKLFIQSVSCPLCAYPNDASFRFCQSCGYTRKVLADAPASSSGVALDVFALDDRLSRIAKSPLFKKSLNSFCLPSLFRRIFLQPSPESYVVFLFGKTGRGRLKYTNPLVRFFFYVFVSLPNVPWLWDSGLPNRKTTCFVQ